MVLKADTNGGGGEVSILGEERGSGATLRTTTLRYYGAHVIASELFQRWPDDDPAAAGEGVEGCWGVGKRRTEMLGGLLHAYTGARDGWSWEGEYFQTRWNR